MSDFRLGVKAAVPTALGYVAIGLAFGVVAAASGLSALEVGLMCALVYGGSAQFAMCALVVAGAGLGELTLTVFLVNLRNMLMSLHATTIFTKTSLWNQLGIGSLITDESYGVLLGEYVHHKDIPANWMHGNNIFSYLVWIVSSVVGCLIGSMIPNPELFGLDFALIAMFIGLLSSQIDALLGEGVRKLLLILLSIAVAYLSFSVVLSESLAVLVKYKGLPDIVVRFLHYLPVSILFALILSSLTTEKIGHLPQFKWMEILATVPTVIVAFKSKNLLYAVIVGIVSMALVRLVF
ncbi:branched-chain amino acid ABC transporter permease [Streptococcus salivarius]|nr:branched-chain amino acid ABC transporter permease [Streptococcus salivarius]